MTIRKAHRQDAQVILGLHAESVRKTCAHDYSSRQIEAWLSRQTLSRYEQRIEKGGMYVCLDETGDIVGFGDRTGPEIHALYVHPAAQGRGVGSHLLAQMERDAEEEGWDAIEATSTLTALAFYHAHGYADVENRKWPSGAADALDAVRVRRTLRTEGPTTSSRQRGNPHA
jgi:N-acetylglutamate synthase-like GNAT family acetyltransferase